ncbi:hypothetical protein SUGI_0724900 [Cryptomeria japonica]|nr:hypothetical protein SUGI_0724900 [Cryptomeria japonica]
MYGLAKQVKQLNGLIDEHKLDDVAYCFCFFYFAVGIDEARLKVTSLLCIEDDVSIKAVVVYGIPGMEGQRAISEACRNASQHLFLFIDNALRGSDLAKLLPENLSWMPKGSKMLLTTRKLNETDMLDQIDIISLSAYPMSSLPPSEGKKLLCKGAFGNSDATFDSSCDIDGLVTVCSGIPLVLDLVGSRLRKYRYNLSLLNRSIQSFKDSLGEG